MALGIAELDRTIGEGVLEWIQVHPDYHRRGYGKVIVEELLRRLESKARFVTVAGRLDDVYNAGELYESCGFVGRDEWLVFRR